MVYVYDSLTGDREDVIDTTYDNPSSVFFALDDGFPDNTVFPAFTPYSDYLLLVDARGKLSDLWTMEDEPLLHETLITLMFIELPLLTMRVLEEEVEAIDGYVEELAEDEEELW